MRPIARLWVGIALLVILAPLGLVLSAYFKAGSAWGEWGAFEIKEIIGYVPKGLAKLSSLWNAPMPDYAFKGWEEKGFPSLSFAYIISAVLGITVIVIVAWFIGRILAKKGD